jgi:type I restriction enzyme, S subunit
MKWEKVEIGQLGEVITGNTPPRKNPELYGDFIPFIKPTDIEIDRRFTPNPEECYSELGFEKYRKSLIPKGATCVVTIGSIGKKITQAITDCFINQAVNAVIPNENYDADFVFYLLKNNLDKVKGLDSGTSSGRENVSKSSFSSIEIKVVKNLPTQRKIASILSAYDDLIENNLKRIKLLEEKALMEYRILFKENKLKEFPIEDVWEIKYGKNLPQTKITEFGKYPVYGAAGRIGFYEEFNYEFPVALVTSRGNGSGVAHRTNQAAFVTNNSFAFVPKEEFVNVHFHLAEMILRDLELTQLRSGTAQPQLTIAGLIGVKLKLPNKEALIEYNKIVDPSFDFIHTLEKQNTKLREARDILLPKLMNGQIEV